MRVKASTLFMSFVFFGIFVCFVLYVLLIQPETKTQVTPQTTTTYTAPALALSNTEENTETVYNPDANTHTENVYGY